MRNSKAPEVALRRGKGTGTLLESRVPHLDAELVASARERIRIWTDDDIRRELAQVQHQLWIADEDRDLSDDYLAILHADLTAYRDELARRRERGYSYRIPVPASYSREHLDYLKRAVTLVDEIRQRSTVSIRKHGRHWIGRCPFHDDRTPSLVIFDDEKDSHYHCFGCGQHGDIFDWLRDYCHLDFRSAVLNLEALAGVAPGKSHMSTAGTEAPSAEITASPIELESEYLDDEVDLWAADDD